jgi:hypothetical protein
VVVAEPRVKSCVLEKCFKLLVSLDLFILCVNLVNRSTSICHPFEWIFSRASHKKESLITLCYLFNYLSNLI